MCLHTYFSTSLSPLLLIELFNLLLDHVWPEVSLKVCQLCDAGQVIVTRLSVHILRTKNLSLTVLLSTQAHGHMHMHMDTHIHNTRTHTYTIHAHTQTQTHTNTTYTQTHAHKINACTYLPFSNDTISFCLLNHLAVPFLQPSRFWNFLLWWMAMINIIISFTRRACPNVCCLIARKQTYKNKSCSRIVS